MTQIETLEMTVPAELRKPGCQSWGTGGVWCSQAVLTLPSAGWNPHSLPESHLRLHWKQTCSNCGFSSSGKKQSEITLSALDNGAKNIFYSFIHKLYKTTTRARASCKEELGCYLPTPPSECQGGNTEGCEVSTLWAPCSSELAAQCGCFPALGENVVWHTSVTAEG